RYFFEQDPTDGNFASNGTRITATNVLPGFPVLSQKIYHAALLRLTSVLSNNFVKESRVSYLRVFIQANKLSTYTTAKLCITDLTASVRRRRHRPRDRRHSHFQRSEWRSVQWEHISEQR